MKKIIKTLILFCVIITLFSLTACGKKKSKHKWIEVDPISTGSVITSFGVQTSKGSDPNAVVIPLCHVYVPLGMDEKGERQYKQIIYEIEELKPEYIDAGLKYYGVITNDSYFCDLVIEDSDKSISAGPGAEAGEKINKSGTVRYLELSSTIDNSDNYKGITDKKKLKGKIDREDVMHCLLTTFEENFQLVDCKFESVTEEEFKKVHPDYEG